MNKIMDHKLWMKQTYVGALTRRSSSLKKVDSAIERYTQSPNLHNLDDLRSNFTQYLQTKGANWKSDKRNNLHALDTLHKQIFNIPQKEKTGADVIALSHLKYESSLILVDLFGNKELEWRPKYVERLRSTKKKIAFKTATTLHKVNAASDGDIADSASRGVKKLTGSSLAEGVTKSLISPPDYQDVLTCLKYIMPNFMAELAASVTPFIGLITSGATTIYRAGETSVAQYEVHRAIVHQQRSLAIAEPERAIAALVTILHRERDWKKQKTVIGFSEFSAKVVGLLVDAGTVTNAAIGLSSKFLELALLVRRIAIDVQERKAANKIMAKPETIDITIFETCPVLGAYLICCAPTSVMVNSVFNRFYEHGWRGEVERYVRKHLDDLKSQAQGVVLEHRFWIPSLKDYSGLKKANKDKINEMMKLKGGQEGIAWDNYISPPELISSTNEQGRISLAQAQQKFGGRAI